MKMWQKILSVTLAFSVAALSRCATEPRENCCLCDSLRYHAPCLIDLETGNMLELDLYFPHETKVAELADEQPEISTFSFVQLENISGIKLTGSRTIKIVVPATEITHIPVLCGRCGTLLQRGYTSRYILADLYHADAIQLIPITEGRVITLRCYQITMTANENGEGITVVIQGIL